jgi:hypothetical protein
MNASQEAGSDAAEASERIERLLAEVRATASPLTWQRVDELVTAIVDLYGRGLGRLLDAVDASRHRELAEDDLVSSLLALHGLHPEPVELRIRRALDEIAPQLGRIELEALDGGVARLRALDAPAARDAASAVERLVLQAAPELERVAIEGLREPVAKGPLVQIDLARSRARAGGG